MTNEKEIWRPIPEFPGHRVSSHGRVAGIHGLIKPGMNTKGYPHVGFWGFDKKITIRLNVLVCRIFHGERPTPLHQAAHWDGVRTNCAASNLRWATLIENREDMKRHGTWQAGEKHKSAKTTNAVALKIRQRYQADKVNTKVPKGWYDAITTEFNLSRSVVRDIVGNRRYTYDKAFVV